MNLLDELIPLGVDVDTGVKHFKGNTAIFERLIKKFPASVKEHDARPLIEQGDIKQAYEYVHALKGICANLYIKSLYELYAEASDTLKAGGTDGVIQLLSDAATIQEQIINVIESA